MKYDDFLSCLYMKLNEIGQDYEGERENYLGVLWVKKKGGINHPLCRLILME